MNTKPIGVIALLILCLATVQAASFEVRDLKVSVTYPAPYDRFSDRIDLDDGLVDGGTIEADIFPGSEVEFIFTVDNLLSETSTDDGDVNNIIGTITVEDLNDNDDVEVETDDIDLNAGNDEKLRATVKVPAKVEAQEYEVEVKVEGDVNGTTESVIINLIMDVKKESSDLKVTEYRVTPSAISCERTIRLYAVMTNLGKDKETDAAFEARSDGLGIVIKKTDIELTDDPFDEDSEYVLNTQFIVDESVAPGTYTIDYSAWFKNQIVMDKRSVELAVAPCASGASGAAAQPEGEQETETPPEQPPATPPSSNEGGEETVATPPGEHLNGEPIVTSSIEKPIISSPLFVAGIIILNILMVVVLVYAGAKAISARKQKGNKPSTKQAEGKEE